MRECLVWTPGKMDILTTKKFCFTIINSSAVQWPIAKPTISIFIAVFEYCNTLASLYHFDPSVLTPEACEYKNFMGLTVKM